MPLSLAMDNGEFSHSGGGGNGGYLVAVATAVVEVVDNRDRWQWHLKVAAALDRGHATNSWCSKRGAQ